MYKLNLIAISAFALVTISARFAQADTELPAYGESCGENIDWNVELEGSGMGSTNWTYETATAVHQNSQDLYVEELGSNQYPNPFAINKLPNGTGLDPNINYADAYVEPGDLIFKKLDNNFWDDYHTGIFAEARYDETSPFIFRMNGISYHSVFSCINCDATKWKDHFIDEHPINLLDFSDYLVNNLQLAQNRWSRRWGTNSGDFWRGSRKPHPGVHGGVELTRSQRMNIVTTGLSVVNSNIDYIFESAIDQENVWNNWGWEGTVGDIDQIRCDGFGEFVYEEAGVRLWGHDDYWNLGSSSDNNYDKHKDSWEGFDFSLDEISPMVQAGCGGYGQGQRTTARSHDWKRTPIITINQAFMSNGRIDFSIQDKESKQVYYAVQFQQNPYSVWRSIINLTRVGTDADGKFNFVYDWNGTWYDQSGQGTVSTYLPDNNYNFRVIAIDEGGNVALKEFSTNGLRLAGTGETHHFYFQSGKTGRVRYRLKLWTASNFDIHFYDFKTGDLLGSGTLGAGQDEHIQFFVRENQDYYAVVSSISGSGLYFLQEYVFYPAKRHKIHELHLTKQGNNWQKNFTGLPHSTQGWAITWSREWEGRDLDMSVTYADGHTHFSTGTSDSEFDFNMGSRGTPTSIWVWEYNPGQLFGSDMLRAKNLFHIWYMDGEGYEYVNDWD